MKHLFMVAVLTAASFSAKAQLVIHNNNPCDIEYAIGCYDPTTCTVTVTPGTHPSYPGFTTVAGTTMPPNTAHPLPTPCNSPDVTFYQIRFVGYTPGVDMETFVSEWGNSCPGNMPPIQHGSGISLSSTCTGGVGYIMPPHTLQVGP